MQSQESAYQRLIDLLRSAQVSLDVCVFCITCADLGDFWNVTLIHLHASLFIPFRDIFLSRFCSFGHLIRGSVFIAQLQYMKYVSLFGFSFGVDRSSAEWERGRARDHG